MNRKTVKAVLDHLMRLGIISTGEALRIMQDYDNRPQELKDNC